MPSTPTEEPGAARVAVSAARSGRSALDALPLLCPVCGEPLSRRSTSLVCPARHSFDIARHGYVNLAVGRPLTGDTAAMVLDRQAFLAAGHYRPLAERVAELAGGLLPRSGSLVVDAGGGTGYYLARVLDRAPRAGGVVLDSSVAALRRAAKAHPGCAAIGWSIWDPWPLRDGSVHLVLDVFAPRNAAEFHRVLRPDGALLVVTPGPDHLAEVRGSARLIGVDEKKEERLERALGPRFRTQSREELTFGLKLDGAGVRQVAGMGPSAHHHDPDDLPPAGAQAQAVTASFVIAVYRPVPLP
jgi:23S rRNA (guanine745-N1)-methyltransferase